MLNLIKLFLRSSLRDKQFLFWEWLFPMVLYLAFALFVRGKAYASFLVPGLFVFMLFQTLIYALPLRIAQFKEEGVLRLVIEEGNIRLFTISFLLHRFVLLVVQALVFVPAGIFILKIDLSQINWGLLAAVYGAAVLALGGFSLLVASLARSFMGAVGWAQVSYMLLSAVSGIFYPLEKSPAFLQALSVCSPLKYARDAFAASLYFNGTYPATALAVLCGLGLGCILIAFWIFTITYRRRDAMSFQAAMS